MNNDALKAFCGILILLSGGFSLYGASGGNYYRMAEINSPYQYFIHIEDFENIYELEHNSAQSNFLSEDFMVMVSDRKYKEAEKWLVEKYEHPYYLLNLVLLYVYFNKEDFTGLFQEWQKSTSQTRMANLVNLMSVRKLHHALEGLSEYWIDPALKFYSNYKIYKEKKQIDFILQNFIQWENFLVHAPEHPESENEFSRKLYDLTKAEWESDKKDLLQNTDVKEAPKIQDEPAFDVNLELTEEKQIEIESSLIEARHSGEILEKILGNYLAYLQYRKQWEKMRTLIEQIPWITVADKQRLLKQFTQWEKDADKPAIQDSTIKLKIRQ